MLCPLADGVYSLTYRSPADVDVAARGLAIVRDKTIIGSDSAGGVFRAHQSACTGRITGTMSIPADGQLITGFRAGPEGMDIALEGTPFDGRGRISFLVDLGMSVITVDATYVGPLPDGLRSNSNALRP